MKKILLRCLSAIVLSILPTIHCHADQVYHDVSTFTKYGTAVDSASVVYTRLPDSLQTVLRPELWKLGRNTAGMSVRFVTDATTISAKWTNTAKTAMNHMCPTGIRGLDLYVLMSDGTWSFAGSARPSLKSESSTSTFVSNMSKGGEREYMMFLPLYDGLESLSVGVNPGATFRESSSPLPSRDKPIVMYGTSILQGGCATRPGMAHTNILQRLFNREVINLGFSGNAHLDPEIAEYMAQIDAGVYVIDVLPNNTAASLEKKLPKFLNILRKYRPDTPILLVESPYYPRCTFDSGYNSGIVGINRMLKKIYDSRISAGDKNIYYLKGDDILDPDREGVIDGVHFTDAGFQSFADAMFPVLKKILSSQ